MNSYRVTCPVCNAKAEIERREGDENTDGFPVTCGNRKCRASLWLVANNPAGHGGPCLVTQAQRDFQYQTILASRAAEMAWRGGSSGRMEP
jgi:hypothetical protein